MFARTILTTARGRRGVVLVVILGMLGLLALVGVTFATFSGQAQISARNFAQGAKFPDVNTVIDYGIQQLINDTDNPLSALRGHSLKRDMYGNDSYFFRKDPTTTPPAVLAVESNGYLTSMPSPFGALFLTASRPNPNAPYQNFLQVLTNIPVGSVVPGLYSGGFSANFTRWYLKVGPWQLPDPNNNNQMLYYAAQTYEVLLDDATGLDPYSFGTDPVSGLQTSMHLLTLSPQDGPLVYDPTSKQVINMPTSMTNNYTAFYGSPTPYASMTSLAAIPFSGGSQQFNTPIQFILDGRYRRAFNGPGMTQWAQYANFRVNGPLMPYPSWDISVPQLGNPDIIGMDEDYDAVDLENWFLAMQSAAGDVVIPSFHRPGILRADLTDPTYPNNPPAPNATNDWRNTSPDSAARFLRPRAVDGHSIASFPDLIPNAAGQIVYDVDNDGDGTNDAVWLDLGYPALRDGQGRMYKPLFAFTVIGLNGRMPLNTVGNIQGRFAVTAFTSPTDMTGYPTWDHTSHLGNSVNEINPKFALQNTPDIVNGVLSVFSSQVDNPDLNAPKTSVALTQLRNILAGTRPQSNPLSPVGDNGDMNYVYMNAGGIPQKYYLPNSIYDPADAIPTSGFVTRQTAPIAGRWGEAEGIPSILNSNFSWPFYQDAVRAGSSGYNLNVDGTDDDFDSLDPFPYNPNQQIYPETTDTWDFAGGVLMPSERMRRWVTPADPVGTGVMVRYGDWPGPAQQSGGFPDYGYGYDSVGRVGFWGYFRPAGLPMVASPSIIPPTPLTPPTGPTDGLTTAAPTTHYFLNQLHGYDSYRIPAGSGVSPSNQPLNSASFGMPATFYGAMPFDNIQVGSPTTIPSVPSFTKVVNSSNWAAVYNGFPFGSPNRDEADEMNLYSNAPFDLPYGVSDLEWLYRLQDIDGASLQSRLASLAPVSFLNPNDGLMRRRMFSVDSWETTNFVWAHDNPGGVGFPINPGGGTAILNPTSASHFPAFGDTTTPATFTPTFLSNPWLSNGSSENLAIMTGPNPNLLVPNPLVYTTSLAHRDRKINLNYPLPASNSPFEPVRLKWIQDAYTMMKQVLPTKAIDTPEEAAQLSQFLVNVIDFRDTDGTITVYVNPDLVLGTIGTMTQLYFANNVPATVTNKQPFVQYGMEYNPIAINEVLAFAWVTNPLSSASSTGPAQTRMFIELVNTLTKAADPGAPTLDAFSVSDIDLSHWELAILPDNTTGQPDPITGQVPAVTDSGPTSTFAQGMGQRLLNQANTQASSGSVVVPALLAGSNAGNYRNPAVNRPYVLAYPQGVLNEKTPPNGTTGNYPAAIPASVAQVLPVYTVDVSKAKPTNQGGWYWLYLRRPANPLLPGQIDPAQPNYNPMVVVDAMRFPYVEATMVPWVQDPNTKEWTPNTTISKMIGNTAFSAQRLQPYRGGHAVADANGNPVYAYGYSEQLVPPRNSSGYYGQYTASKTTYQDTNPIFETIGDANTPHDASWDYPMFHDRDFTSVAELLLVPGCPPGLFTKQFVEEPPQATGGIQWQPISNIYSQGANPPAGKSSGNNWGDVFRLDNDQTLIAVTGNPAPVPHSFPYLPDEFYYTAAYLNSPGNPVNDPGGVIGGPAGQGWHRMLEFFEVPTSANGSYGPVANGQNFDWFRQDLKPGLMNLNLIIDQEVFLGLIDDPRINSTPATQTSILPQVVTQVDPTGFPTGRYFMNNRAMFYELGTQPSNGVPTFVPLPGLTAAFCDFLKLRHGGSGFLFAWQSGLVGGGSAALTNAQTPAAARAVAVERPFRSLSFPDIDYTVMRPATLPPSPYTTAPPNYQTLVGTAVSIDPGVKGNPALYQQKPTITTSGSPLYAGGTSTGNPPPIPPIPARRLFEVPDFYGSFPPPSNNAGTWTPSYNPPSNASEYGDPFDVNLQIIHPDLANANANLVLNVQPQSSVVPVPPYLGANTNLATGLGASAVDMRQHPYYRSEWLQKIMNLTTVRTHQFAVWITVGFFEVTRQGTPTQAIPDSLGIELGKATGDNKRYRAFFVVDRTKATGLFIPFPLLGSNDYHDCVLFRRIIQ